MDPHDKDRLDEWLDGALQQYGQAEPRPGLENRILANLEARNTSPVQRDWRWVFLGVTAMLAVIAVLLMWKGLAGDRQRLPLHVQGTGAAGATARAQSGNDTGRGATAKGTEINARAALDMQSKDVSHARFARGRSPNVRVARHQPEPKLRQFPSERPLSEQERLLTEYVAQFPDQARLVAQEQAKTEKEMDQLYAENAQHSSQQER